MKLPTPSLLESTRRSTPDFGGPPLNGTHHGFIKVRGLGSLRFRPIQSTDETEMIRFHDLFSDSSVNMSYFRYMGWNRRSAYNLEAPMFMNTLESYAVVMERAASPHSPATILGVGRLAKTEDALVASFDMLIPKELKATQLSTALLHRLINLARAFDFHDLSGKFSDTDDDQLKLCRRLGFSIQHPPEHGLIGVKIHL